MMAAFADQAALAWQLATTQRHLRELDVLTDRDRIARDLHDHVIQRLFAIGLALQGTIPRARSPEVQRRLSGSVDDLQGVIQEIRTAIFDLHGGSTRSDPAAPAPRRGDRRILPCRCTHHGAIRRSALGHRAPPWPITGKQLCARHSATRYATVAPPR